MKRFFASKTNWTALLGILLTWLRAEGHIDDPVYEALVTTTGFLVAMFLRHTVLRAANGGVR